MSETAILSAEAVEAGEGLPPLLADAERAAASVWGVHGRRATGMGESFWQYRHAQPGDAQHSIDWRRSGRSDELFVRETEWEATQTVMIWSDDSASMQYASAKAPVTKARRAAVLSLATAMLLERAEERFAPMREEGARLLRGRAGIEKFALLLTRADTPGAESGSPPETTRYPINARAAFFSDFFGDITRLRAAMERAVSRRVSGVLVQIVDPAEEAFPYRGRVLFESVGGGLSYEADRADALREAYQTKLAERRDELRDMARESGWRLLIHRTDQPIPPVLMALHETLSLKKGTK